MIGSSTEFGTWAEPTGLRSNCVFHARIMGTPRVPVFAPRADCQFAAGSEKKGETISIGSQVSGARPGELDSFDVSVLLHLSGRAHDFGGDQRSRYHASPAAPSSAGRKSLACRRRTWWQACDPGGGGPGKRRQAGGWTVINQIAGQRFRYRRLRDGRDSFSANDITEHAKARSR